MLEVIRAAHLIARRDLRTMLQHRETLLWVFVMPVLFFYFVGTIAGGTGVGATGAEVVSVSVWAPAITEPLVDRLTRHLQIQAYSPAPASSRAEAAEATHGLIIANERARSGDATGDAAGSAAITLEYHVTGAGPRANADRERLARAVHGLAADLVASTANVEASRPSSIQIVVQDATGRSPSARPYTQTAIATLVMFTLLVLLTNGSMLIVIEREQGLLHRLAATPLPRHGVAIGKISARTILGLVQVAFGVVAGSALFDVDWGPHLATVALVVALWAICCASAGLLLANLVSTEAQAAACGISTAMALSALGGCWWPIEVAPPWLHRIAYAVPTGWTMDALHRLVGLELGLGSVFQHLTASSVAAGLLGLAAVRTFRTSRVRNGT